MCMKNRWNPTIDRSQKCQGCASFKWRTLVESFALECHHGSRGAFRVTGDIKPNANVYGWDGDGSGMKYPCNFYKISVRAGEIWYVVNRSYIYIDTYILYDTYLLYAEAVGGISSELCRRWEDVSVFFRKTIFSFQFHIETDALIIFKEHLDRSAYYPSLGFTRVVMSKSTFGGPTKGSKTVLECLARSVRMAKYNHISLNVFYFPPLEMWLLFWDSLWDLLFRRSIVGFITRVIWFWQYSVSTFFLLPLPCTTALPQKKLGWSKGRAPCDFNLFHPYTWLILTMLGGWNWYIYGCFQK